MPKNRGKSQRSKSLPFSMVYVCTTNVSLTLGTAPYNGTHAGRLAVDQVHGYMSRNRKALGIITTMTGWVFLKLELGGRLVMTSMLACSQTQHHKNSVPPETLFSRSRTGIAPPRKYSRMTNVAPRTMANHSSRNGVMSRFAQ